MSITLGDAATFFKLFGAFGGLFVALSAHSVGILPTAANRLEALVGDICVMAAMNICSLNMRNLAFSVGVHAITADNGAIRNDFAESPSLIQTPNHIALTLMTITGINVTFYAPQNINALQSTQQELSPARSFGVRIPNSHF